MQGEVDFQERFWVMIMVSIRRVAGNWNTVGGLQVFAIFGAISDLIVIDFISSTVIINIGILGYRV